MDEDYFYFLLISKKRIRYELYFYMIGCVKGFKDANHKMLIIIIIIVAMSVITIFVSVLYDRQMCVWDLWLDDFFVPN